MANKQKNSAYASYIWIQLKHIIYLIPTSLIYTQTDLFVGLCKSRTHTFHWLAGVTIRAWLTAEPWGCVYTFYTRETGVKLAL